MSVFFNVVNVAFQRSDSRTGDDDRKDHECENVLRYVNSQYSVLARSHAHACIAQSALEHSFVKLLAHYHC